MIQDGADLPEAVGADLGTLGIERGHRSLTVLRVSSHFGQGARQLTLAAPPEVYTLQSRETIVDFDTPPACGACLAEDTAVAETTVSLTG